MDITALQLNMKGGEKFGISIDKMGREKLMAFIDFASALYQEGGNVGDGGREKPEIETATTLMQNVPPISELKF